MISIVVIIIFIIIVIIFIIIIIVIIIIKILILIIINLTKYFCFGINKLKPKCSFNPLSANPTKWSNTLKHFVGKLPTNYLSVCNHFVKLALKG